MSNIYQVFFCFLPLLCLLFYTTYSYSVSPQMPWYGREWGESALPLEMLSHGHAYIASAREVLLTAFSWHYCCLRNWEDEKRMSGALTGLVDMEGPPRGVGKPWFQTNGAHGLQYPEGTNGVWINRWSPATMGLHLLTMLHCLVDQTFRSKAPGVVPCFSLGTWAVS